MDWLGRKIRPGLTAILITTSFLPKTLSTRTSRRFSASKVPSIHLPILKLRGGNSNFLQFSYCGPWRFNWCGKPDIGNVVSGRGGIRIFNPLKPAEEDLVRADLVRAIFGVNLRWFGDGESGTHEKNSKSRILKYSHCNRGSFSLLWSVLCRSTILST